MADEAVFNADLVLVGLAMCWAAALCVFLSFKYEERLELLPLLAWPLGGSGLMVTLGGLAAFQLVEAFTTVKGCLAIALLAAVVSTILYTVNETNPKIDLSIPAGVILGIFCGAATPARGLRKPAGPHRPFHLAHTHPTTGSIVSDCAEHSKLDVRRSARRRLLQQNRRAKAGTESR